MRWGERESSGMLLKLRGEISAEKEEYDFKKVENDEADEMRKYAFLPFLLEIVQRTSHAYIRTFFNRQFFLSFSAVFLPHILSFKFQNLLRIFSKSFLDFFLTISSIYI